MPTTTTETRRFDPQEQARKLQTKKMNAMYELRLEEYVEKFYKKVDQNWYAGKDKEHTYHFKDNHLLVICASNDMHHHKDESVKARSLWKEIDPANPNESIAAGNIFTLIAREQGIKNTKQTYRDVLLPRVQEVLGKYTQEQVNTTTAKNNKIKTKRYQKATLSGIDKLKAIDEKVRRDMLIPMIYNVINEVEKSGTLFGKEPKAMPLVIHPINLPASNKIPTERNCSPDDFMKGLQYIQEMQDSVTVDKRFVQTKYTNSSYKGFESRGISVVSKSKYGKPFIYIDHRSADGFSEVTDGKKQIDFFKRQYMRPVSDLLENGAPVPVYEFGPNDNKKIAQNILAAYGGCFKTKDEELNKALREELEADPVKAFRKAVEYHSGLDNIKRNEGLRILQRELIVEWGLHSCGYKGGIEIPEKDREILVGFLREDVIGKDKSVRQGNVYVKEKQLPGTYFNMAVMNMDRKNNIMRSKEEVQTRTDAAISIERKKFEGISIVMDSAYRNRRKDFYPRGAGSGQRKIQGMAAYNLLADMLLKDKEMYDNARQLDENPKLKERYTAEDKKEVRLSLFIKDKNGVTLPPMKLAFQPGHLDMNNAPRVSEAIIALQARQEYDNAYNKNTIDRNYKLYVENQQFDNPSFKSTAETRYDFIESERSKFNAKMKSLRAELKEFQQDEAIMLQDNPELKRNLERKADTYFYAIPKDASREMILEGYESKNIVLLTTPKQNNKDYNIVELRNQLDVVKDGDTIVRNDQDKAYYFDPTPAHRDATEKLHAVPFLSDTEVQQSIDFNEKFTVKIKDGIDDLTLKGDTAREELINRMIMDRDSFEQERDLKQRFEDDVKPYTIEISYDGKPLFQETAHYGELKMANYTSVEEMVASKRDSMDEETEKSLDAALKAGRTAKKYSEYKSFEDEIRTYEKIDQKTIEAVRKQPMQSYDVVNSEEPLSRVEELERNAKVNYIEEPKQVMEFVVTGLAKDIKKLKLDNPMEVVRKQIEAERPESKKVLDEVLKTPKMEKMLKAKGVHRTQSQAEKER